MITAKKKNKQKNWIAQIAIFRLRSFNCLLINKLRKSKEEVMLSHDLRRSHNMYFIQNIMWKGNTTTYYVL